MTRDLVNRIRTVVALAPATVTTSTDGLTVATQGFDAVAFQVIAGPSGDTLSTNVQVEFDLAQSFDGTTWTYCGDYDVITTPPESSSHTGIGVANGANNSGAFFVASSSTPFALVGGLQPVFGASYIGVAPYVRCHIHLTGSHTNGIPVQAVAILGRPNYIPTSGNLS